MAEIKITKIRGKNEFSIHGLTLGKIITIQTALVKLNTTEDIKFDTYNGINNALESIGANNPNYDEFS
jgi:hypothetical protein